MIRINLVPREILDAEDQHRRTIQAGLAIVLVLVVGAIFSVWRVRKVASLEAQVQEKQTIYDGLQKTVEQAKALENEKASLNGRIDAIKTELKGRPLYPIFMADFAETLPGPVWVKTLTTTKVSRNELTVSATASSSTSEGVADWLRKLEGHDLFKDPVLSAISIVASESARIHNFSVSMKYTNPKL